MLLGEGEISMGMKTMVAVGNTINKMDTVEFEGRYWLVPSWLVSPDGKWQRPVRIICLSSLEHQNLGNGEFVLTLPLPAALAANQIDPPSPIDGFLVLEQPQIVVPAPSAAH
jgi:hypothetical protein